MAENTNQPQDDKSAWADAKFDSMKSIESPRTVELPEDELGGGMGSDHASFTEQVEHGARPSDVAIVIKQLFADLGVYWLTMLQMARVLPQYYDHLKYICVTELIRNYRMPVAKAIALTEIAVGVALDGEARIEAIAVIGKSEASEEAKAKTGIGLPM